jgi:hypothetical protein
VGLGDRQPPLAQLMRAGARVADRVSNSVRRETQSDTALRRLERGAEELELPVEYGGRWAPRSLPCAARDSGFYLPRDGAGSTW